MSGLEEAYIQQAFATNWIAPLGPNVTGFEEDLQNYLGEGNSVAALSSGTAALHLGLQLLGVGKGDFVICQSFTFSASANPIVYLGAEPVFIDSETKSWNLSPELLEEAIQACIRKGKKPKAIVAVHLYGMPYLVKEVHEVADKYEIPILEDSAEALGSEYEGVRCGNFGEIAILSFNGNKIITTSGGGALVSKNKSYTEKAVFLATQARDNAPHYQHSHIGYNYRMSNVLAGIGRGQVRVLNERVGARRAVYEHYRNTLGRFSEIQFQSEYVGSYANRWLTCLLTPSYKIRERIRLALLQENIESRPLWKPLHMQPVFEEYMNFSDGTSEDFFNRGLCLPSGSNLTEEDLERIVDVIVKTLSHD